jgi:SAM-dependent methyltransferase
MLDHTCKACGGRALEQITEYSALVRVTSDCVPFRDGGVLFVCLQCGAAQSLASDQWFQEVREIYRTYSAYHQSGGTEQHVVDPLSGGLRERSEVLLDKLMTVPGMPPSGKVLDVGCATGGTLRAFARRGGWLLFGLELDERSLPLLESIEGFQMLYTCEPADVPGQFCLVTMVHSLEHFPEPLRTLRDLRRKISAEGRLFVQVPNAEANAFDYVIADHMVHFSPSTLTTLLRVSGFEMDCLATSWVAKEISAMASPAESPATARPPAPTPSIEYVRNQIGWLLRLVESAREAAEGKRFGLFGSSIAATWLCSVLGDRVSFFVEEDVNRIGRTHLGRPIVSPDQVQDESVVFMALAPQIARTIAARLGARISGLRLPPS